MPIIQIGAQIDGKMAMPGPGDPNDDDMGLMGDTAPAPVGMTAEKAGALVPKVIDGARRR